MIFFLKFRFEKFLSFIEICYQFIGKPETIQDSFLNNMMFISIQICMQFFTEHFLFRKQLINKQDVKS